MEKRMAEPKKDETTKQLIAQQQQLERMDFAAQRQYWHG
jgi:hypothetical protein